MKSVKKLTAKDIDPINSALYIVKEGVVDINLTGRYVSAYMLDQAGNYSFIYGLRSIFDDTFKKNLKVNNIHRYARDLAFSGKSISYEWFENTPAPTFFRTIVIPLSNETGKVSSLLCIINTLEEISVGTKNMILAEKTGQSFVRIIMDAREEEKRLIASAIHDQLGNFSIRTNALIEILRDDIKEKSAQEALKSLQDLQKAVQESVHAMKEIITSLRPLQLEAVGLDASLRDLLEKVSQTETIKIKYDYKVNEKTVLSKNTKLILYRAVQEALSNTVKHAQAKHFSVELEEDKLNIYLTLKDDGKGFKPQAHKSVKSLGLEGMKENIASLKGTMKLTSKLGQGTTISIKCPKFNYER